MNTKCKNNRNLSLDLLRCIAAIMVITMHVIADNFYSLEPESLNFSILIFINSFCRSAVPIFFMISGAFSNTTNIKKVIQKAIQYTVIFLLISTLYGINDIIYCEEISSIKDLVFKENIIEMLGDEIVHYKYHLWYLPVYVFVLLITPIVNCCCEQSEKYTRYMSVIFIIYITIQTVNLFLPYDSLIYRFVNIIPFTGSYIGYFIWGKFLFNTNISSKCRRLVYILGGISFLAIFIFSRAISIECGTANEKYFTHFAVFVFLCATFYFMLFKNMKINGQMARIIEWITPHTFNIYLFHVFFIEYFNRYFDFKACSIFPVFGVPLKVILVFGLSAILSMFIELSKRLIKKAYNQ